MELLEASYFKSQIAGAVAAIFMAFMAIIMGYLAYLANYYVVEQLWLARLEDLRQEEEHFVVYYEQRSRYVERKAELVSARARADRSRLVAFFRRPPALTSPSDVSPEAHPPPTPSIYYTASSLGSSRRRNQRSTDVEGRAEE